MNAAAASNEAKIRPLLVCGIAQARPTRPPPAPLRIELERRHQAAGARSDRAGPMIAKGPFVSACNSTCISGARMLESMTVVGIAESDYYGSHFERGETRTSRD